MRASICEIFASSMRSFGLIATAKTGSPAGTRGSSTLCPFEVSVSPVATVSSRRERDDRPRAGLRRSLLVSFLAAGKARPRRAFSSRLLTFVSVASALSVPERMRAIESFPLCGWIAVLMTRTMTGAVGIGRDRPSLGIGKCGAFAG